MYHNWVASLVTLDTVGDIEGSVVFEKESYWGGRLRIKGNDDA